MDHYSYSKLNLYDGCPRAFHERYIEKRPEVESDALKLGSEVHEWIAEYNKHLVRAGTSTDLAFLRDAGCSGECREMLDRYGETHLLELGTYRIEEMWKLPVGRFTLWAKIDLLRDQETVITIEDLKSDHALRSQAALEKDFQLQTYAWCAGQKYPAAESFLCTLDFVRHGVTRSVTYTRDDLPEIETEILRRIEVIEADKDYAPTPGSQCEWCSWTKTCPAIKEGGIEVITCTEDAVTLAEEKIAIEARLKRVNSLLQPHCTAEGPIQSNGMEVGYWRSESITYPDTIALDRVLIDNNLNHFDYYKPDVTALKKLKGDVGKDLDAIAVDPGKTSFRARKVQGRCKYETH